MGWATTGKPIKFLPKVTDINQDINDRKMDWIKTEKGGSSDGKFDFG